MTLPVLLVVLMLLDTFLSYYGVYHLGIPEANPLLNKLKPDSFLFIKLMSTALVYVLLYLAYSLVEQRPNPKLKKLITYSVLPVLAFYSFVVANNIYWVVVWFHVR
ncbi:MAG: DUF5658 family protein [Nanopusillaceae archaeon]